MIIKKLNKQSKEGSKTKSERQIPPKNQSELDLAEFKIFLGMILIILESWFKSWQK